MTISYDNERWWSRWTRKRKLESSRGRASAGMRHLIPQCPLCSSEPKGHEAALLASVTLGNDGTNSAKLRSFIELQQWEEAAAISEAEFGTDNLQFYVVRCSKKKEYFVGEFVFKYALWSDDEFLRYKKVVPKDYSRLDQLVRGDWILL